MTTDQLEAVVDRLELLADRLTSHAHERAWEAVQADRAELDELERELYRQTPKGE